MCTAGALLGDSEWTACFEEDPGFIARLSPVDYHRFHFPDDGELLASWRIPGALYSLNPWALAQRGDLFMLNERQVSILQTHSGRTFHRGDEKGLFLFGGSTVIVLGEAGCWQIEASLLANTDAGLETYLQLGSRLGQAADSC